MIHLFFYPYPFSTSYSNITTGYIQPGLFMEHALEDERRRLDEVWLHE
ncbi:hypothetical protein I5677_05105 [Mobilitalea sibirica]|uniref:Uncharacterized protein n=1 Tax=Mobilitalea sibirica TaxID=1462919 RepID=A0A8J7H1H0_9FIRM|nr:hypothetical protein [Mobilitalea sibirica]MBH1940274.1 hypothetical protein [Mobilitalea sibirica]